jgi:hypothetical protein
MTDIPRWPKISLLDDPDEEERAKRQLNESRRKRGLEPLYPEAGFPDVPGVIDTLFGGGKPIPLGGYRDEAPEPEKPGPIPMPQIDPKDIKDGASGGAGSQVAQAEPSSAGSKADGQKTETAPAPDKEAAAPPKPGKPLTYEQVKELVRENNRSKLPDEMIIAVIFKESSFNPGAHNRTKDSDEAGLMQMTRGAWTDAHRRLAKGTKHEFEGSAFDPAINIQLGSTYLQQRIDWARGNLEEGIAGYGTGKPEYAQDIIAATKALQQNPDDPVAVISRIYRRKYP